jgi:outer membrane protein TolC
MGSLPVHRREDLTVALEQRRFWRARSLGAVALACVVAGCTVSPKPLTDQERSTQAQSDRAAMFGNQEPLAGPLTLDQAFARALKYNLDQRVKLMEEAVARDDLDLTKYDLLPKLVADAGYLNRSNADASSSRNIATQEQSLAPSVSSDRDRRVADLTVSWNILDFGVSYFNAREQADRSLIAEEERRKVVQSLFEDVRGAFWRAASAQKLANGVNDAIGNAQTALTAARGVETERLRAPIDALRYQKALLDLLHQLQTVQITLAVSKTELASLINLPPGEDYTIAVPAESTMTIDPLTTPIDQMEQTALLRNPDLREEAYQTRISVDETHKAITQMLPGITFSYGKNYDSNSFLVNNTWYQGAAQLSWNLLNLISAPDHLHRAHEGEMLEDMKRQAVSMTVLAKMHIAYQQYLSAAKEYQWSAQASDVDQRLYQQIANRTATDAQGELERISAQVSAVTSDLLRYQSYADAQAALGRLYSSLGVDPTPDKVASLDIATLSKAVAEVMKSWQNGDALKKASDVTASSDSAAAAPPALLAPPSAPRSANPPADVTAATATDTPPHSKFETWLSSLFSP